MLIMQREVERMKQLLMRTKKGKEKAKLQETIREFTEEIARMEGLGVKPKK
jgi:hypothetical protein